MRVVGLFLCPETKKRQYVDRGQAEAEIGRIRQRAVNPTYVPARAYQCPHCDYWHLTSLTDQAARIPVAAWHEIVGTPGQPLDRKAERRDTLAAIREDQAIIGARIDEGEALHVATRAGHGSGTVTAVDLYDRFQARRKDLGWPHLSRLVVSRWPSGTPDKMLTEIGFYQPDRSTLKAQSVD